MNIEQFKISLYKQFKQTDAPIRALMFKRGITNVDNRHMYHDAAVLVARDFELHIYVKKVCDSSGSIQFDLCFDDVSNEYEPNWNDYQDVDLSIIDNDEGLYYSEYITMDGCRVAFGLNIFKLKAKNYDFYKTNELKGYRLVYNINEHKFENEQLVAETLNAWKELRNNPDNSYLDLLTGSFKDLTVSGIQGLASFPIPNACAFIGALASITTGGEVSTMTQIVNSLINIKMNTK